MTSNSPILVIGVGVERTGTKSLQEALEILYRSPCYHSSEIVQNHPEHVDVWLKIFTTTKTAKKRQILEELVKSVFDGYLATVGHPACTIYKQLLDIYPEAKVIITTRPSLQWLESMRETVLPSRRLLSKGLLSRILERFVSVKGFGLMMHRSTKYVYGKKTRQSSDKKMLDAFERWMDDVIETVPSERLLIFQVEQGWAPLCEFLQLPTPDVPFPHSNQRSETLDTMDQLKTAKMRLAILVSVVPTMCILFIGAIILCVTMRPR
ncbi:hypothetical protein T265_14864, partial [Opisthorchis viverrini]